MSMVVTRISSKEKIEKLLKKIKIIEIKKEIFGETDEEDILTQNEVKILIECANLLAYSSNVNDKKKALEIATTLPMINPAKGVSMAAFLILRKLGNYPAIFLLQKKKELLDYKTLLDGMTFLETTVLETTNERTLIGETYLLTNFQKKISDLSASFNGISVSAPTSAGKSFIFLKLLLDKIINNPGATAIYIVPTRALIRQVMNDLSTYVQELKLKNINISCSSEIEVLIDPSIRSNILVLTQERLYHLCANVVSATKLKTEIIIVDEAHNIQNGSRGVLLESSIKFSQRIWPKARILFSSPLVENPEKLLEAFEITEGKEEKETLPLVRQNLIKVDLKGGKLTAKALFEDDWEEKNIGEIKFQRNRMPDYKLFANVTYALWNQQPSIIYANGAMNSADIIRELSTKENFPVLNNERLNEFADFIQEYIAENYELADFIRCGLAFHFGSLPPIIRSGIEDLFKSGDLKIISCTSTLLEGMNLPAKNIFVHRPQKGKNEPIDKLNFWNLVGRAGRMGTDFSGNIICIEVDTWVDNPIQGKREQIITTSIEEKLKTESLKFKSYLLSEEAKLDDYSEQLTSVILTDRVRGKTLIGSRYENVDNTETLSDIDEIMNNILNDFVPPVELIEKIPGILPKKINALWNFFNESYSRGNLNDLSPLYPQPNYGDSYYRFKKMISLYGKFFESDSWSPQFINKISMTSFRWMLGNSLSSIIFYDSSALLKTKKKLTSHVKSEIEFLNNTIRYKIVKYTQAYIDTLKYFLISIDKQLESDQLVNLSAYLEYGACSIPALEFMAIGLPREAAVELAKLIDSPEKYTSKICVEWLKNLDIEALDVSEFLKKQIYSIQTTL